MKSFSNPAKLFIAVVIICGISILGYAILNRESIVPARFAAFLLITVLAARLNVKLPGISGTMSVNLPFILIALTQLSLLETLIISCTSAFVQCLDKNKKPNPVKLAFNFCNMANSIGASFLVYNLSQSADPETKTILLAAAAATYFFVNTAPVAIVIGITEQKNAARIWSEVFLWTYPYYLGSAGLASMASTLSRLAGWATPLVLLPLAFGLYCSYRKYFVGSQQSRPTDPQSFRAAAAHN